MLKNNSNTGLNHWLHQRLSAIFLIIAAFIIILLSIKLKLKYGAISWQHLFNYFFIKVLIQLSVIAIAIHAKIGMSDIFMDYIKCNYIRKAANIVALFWLLVCAIYSIKTIWF